MGKQVGEGGRPKRRKGKSSFSLVLKKRTKRWGPSPGKRRKALVLLVG